MAFNSSKIVKVIATSGVFAYSLFNLFYNLDAESFYTDEVTYSLSGMEYLQGNFTRNPEHPFLGKYLIGVSLRALGKSDFNARLPCALLGFLTGIVLCFFVKELINFGRPRFVAADGPVRSRPQGRPQRGAQRDSQQAATIQCDPSNFYISLIAVALWSTSTLVLWVSRRAILDAFLVFFFTLSLFMFWRFFRTEEAKYALGGGISVGLALSCKLTAAVIVPILLAYVGIGERRIPKPASLGKLALALLIALLILFASYAPVRGDLSDVFRVMGEHWSIEQKTGHRAIIGGVMYDKQPWWTYLYWYWQGYIPYWRPYPLGLLLLLGAGFCFALVRREKSDLFLVSAFLLPFAYLSFYLSFKMYRYAAVFEPPLIIMACSFVSWAGSHLRQRRTYLRLAAAFLLILILLHPMAITAWRTLCQEETEYKAVARFLGPRLGEGDTVFVWGYTDVMEWYLGSKVEIVGGYTTGHLKGNYDADYLIVSPNMSSRWPDDPLIGFLEANRMAYEEHAIGGLKLYVRLASTRGKPNREDHYIMKPEAIAETNFPAFQPAWGWKSLCYKLKWAKAHSQESAFQPT